jgi:Mrp family chromosome partitioning ATPase
MTVVSSGVRSPVAAVEIPVLNAVRSVLDRYELASGSADLPQRIAVVAASSGEGVTTVSLALAEILASDYGESVCWVDVSGADQEISSRPKATTARSAAPPSAGTGVVRAPMLRPPAVSVAKGEVATVDLRNALGRSDLDLAVKELAADYRHVIFDVPPLLSDVSSLGLLRHADAYVLVVRHGSTTMKQVRALAEMLRRVSPLGVVLNDYRTRTPRFVQRFFSD